MKRKFDSSESISFNDEVYEPEENLYNSTGDNSGSHYENTLPKVKDINKGQKKDKK